MCNKIDMNKVQTNPELINMEDQLIEKKRKLRLLGPTSCLWLQYIKMVDILKSSIRSDRVGASHEAK